MAKAAAVPTAANVAIPTRAISCRYIGTLSLLEYARPISLPYRANYDHWSLMRPGRVLLCCG
jgi:hypothetical protein